jgi:putative ABC transport system permease protein
MAVRAALGAGRGALALQLLVESVLLALAGGALGLLLGWAATRALVTFGAGLLPYAAPVVMDWRVLSFALAVAAASGVAFGIVPALELSRTGVDPILRSEGRGVTAGRARLKSTLVVAQTALSMVLVIGAGLLVRSFAALLRIDPGFDPSRVLTMNVSIPTVKYGDARKQVAFFDELLRRVSALPGVRMAAVSAALPLAQVRMTPMLPEGQPEVPLGQRPLHFIEAVSPGFLATMRIPLRAGRAFTAADTGTMPRVLIVNETLARRYWPNQSAVGRHIALGRQPMAEIVGVAGDSRNNGLALDPVPQVYIPFAQLPWGNMNLLVRAAVEPRSLISAVRAQVSALDPDQPVTRIQTAGELMDSSRAQPRFTMLLLGVFSAVSVVLAAVGIYGVLAQAVNERRQELGIRLALGAGRAALVRLVLARGLVLTGAGIGLGLAAALAATRVLQSVLFQVDARDPATFALAPLAFAIVGLLASYLPARRATRVDPVEVLRSA